MEIPVQSECTANTDLGQEESFALYILLQKIKPQFRIAKADT